jgi:hypothetical protein
MYHFSYCSFEAFLPPRREMTQQSLGNMIIVFLYMLQLLCGLLCIFIQTRWADRQPLKARRPSLLRINLFVSLLHTGFFSAGTLRPEDPVATALAMLGHTTIAVFTAVSYMVLAASLYYQFNLTALKLQSAAQSQDMSPQMIQELVQQRRKLERVKLITKGRSVLVLYGINALFGIAYFIFISSISKSWTDLYPCRISTTIMSAIFFFGILAISMMFNHVCTSSLPVCMPLRFS